MARIKCRYGVPYCYHPSRDSQDRYARLYHFPQWFCDSNEWCESSGYQRPEDANKRIVNPQCAWCHYERYEFEKEVKSYEYVSGGGLRIGRKFYKGGLRIGRKFYDSFDIDYLEIDGRVLIGEKESEQ